MDKASRPTKAHLCKIFSSARKGPKEKTFGSICNSVWLAAERDNTLRAAVAFAAGAGSWERSPELRKRLLTAVDNAKAPIMLVQAANDYSTAPSRALADELDRLHKPYLLKIYPPVGQTPDNGHNFVYTGINQWENDVFRFLDEHLKH
ncbi:MAG: hypothetical protein DMF42_09410 [Verrucomicrobia bacterium]|nr:MAG: hypothetical protein DMF42_09410 [Verrucomicrobiota bacterium]